MTTFHRPLPPANDSSSAIFPQRCVGCSRPPETESRLVLKRLVARNTRSNPQPVTWESGIPHCRRCARATQTVFLAGCLPFVLGLLGVGLAAFALVAFGAAWLGLDNYGQLNNANSLVLGAAAGLLAGLLGGFVFELAARLLLLPFLGPTLLRAPLFAAQMLTDVDYVAGLSGRLKANGTRVELTFTQPEIAREFGSLNAGAWVSGQSP